MTPVRRIAAVLDPDNHPPRVANALITAYALAFTAAAYAGLVLALAAGGAR